VRQPHRKPQTLLGEQRDQRAPEPVDFRACCR
jgi:hypothetical protein